MVKELFDAEKNTWMSFATAIEELERKKKDTGWLPEEDEIKLERLKDNLRRTADEPAKGNKSGIVKG